MVFKDLPVGAKFYFGRQTIKTYSYASRTHEDVVAPMQWTKTALDNLVIYTGRHRVVASFDHPRPMTGTNRDQRSHGHRLFSLSSLNKYLNCADLTWRAVDQGDIAPHENVAGFLSFFDEDEMKYIVPHTINIPVPAGYNKQYGTNVSQTVLVTIPTQEQLGQGSDMGTFGMSCGNVSTWVMNSSAHCRMWYGGYYSGSNADSRQNVAPVMKIDPDAPIDTDVEGNYIIRIPEPEFEGDIVKFLALEFEEAA